MNDRIIHAPISKIVEAIRNNEHSIIEDYDNSGLPQEVRINERKLIEALASLESHPSEREVLEGYEKWKQTSSPYFHWKTYIDRYLAEKGVEG